MHVLSISVALVCVILVGLIMAGKIPFVNNMSNSFDEFLHT